MGTFGLRPKGTLSRRALPWAQALARQGHTVTLLAPPWDWPADAGRRAWVGGVEIVQVRVDGGPLAILARLLLAIWQRRPTVVIACKPKGYSGLVLWWLWWQRRLGAWRGQLWLDMDDWETGWNKRLAYPRPLARFFAWQEPWCLAHADRVTAASRWLAAYAAAARRQSARSPDCRTRSASAPAQPDCRTRSAPAPIVHLPNGMDRVSFTGDLTVAPHGPPTALLYTRFVEVTPARIVRVWAQVVRQVPSARLIVIGDATPGGRFERPLTLSPAAALHALATAAELAGSIVVLGWTPATALPGIFAAADVAWAPAADTAINRARCSVKLVEMLAAGLPLVADDVGEVSTYVTPGVNGLLIPPAADALTAQALCQLLTDRPLARSLGLAAARRVAGNFLWDRLVERLLRPETGDRRPETGDRRPETRDWRPETGDRRPETGDRRPETGDWRSSAFHVPDL